MDDVHEVVRRCQELVCLFMTASREETFLPPPHASDDPGATLEDHLLTTSALAYCLAYHRLDEETLHLLRLAALTHDLPERQSRLGKLAPRVQPWIDLLLEQGSALDAGQELPPSHFVTDEAGQILALAHLAASRRLAVRRSEDFLRHPLAEPGGVDLLYGGATKVKEYVFESARLPEIRGASVLLDHINRLDLPALWGWMPSQVESGYEGAEAQMERYREVRDWFEEQFGQPPLEAPECLLYASGGKLLALAPRGHGARLARAIEQRYTRVTQVASSVAVSGSFTLLELQYGRAPEHFWVDKAKTLWTEHPEVAALLEQSLGRRLPREETDFAEAFLKTRGFGQLVTQLMTEARQRRTGGAGQDELPPRPFVELSSHARKCASCDVRPASQEIEYQPGDTRFFCHACYQKHRAGRWAKKGEQVEGYEWIRPWGSWLEEREPGIRVDETANDLSDISPDGFVALIYADGNNVGAHVAGLTSISGYRRFAQQMLEANEQAVAKTLKAFLQPDSKEKRWPFEILTLGGDDVLLFVPARHALEMTLEIAGHFEEELKRFDSESSISLSAGVLLMPENTPIRFASDLVEELLRSAKQRKGEAAVDFMSLKAVPMVTGRIHDFRKVALQRKPLGGSGKETLRLTQRPYPLKALDTLLAATRALKQAHFPRSQLHQLHRCLESGSLIQSAVDYAYFVTRGRQRGKKEAANPFELFDRHLEKLCESDLWLPWRVLEPTAENPISYDTPLLDLIELYPFIDPYSERGAS